MNKTDRPADELIAEAVKKLEDAYYLLNDAAETQNNDRYMRQSILILRRIVSNAHITIYDFLKDMEGDE